LFNGEGAREFGFAGEVPLAPLRLDFFDFGEGARGIEISEGEEFEGGDAVGVLDVDGGDVAAADDGDFGFGGHKDVIGEEGERREVSTELCR